MPICGAILPNRMHKGVLGYNQQASHPMIVGVRTALLPCDEIHKHLPSGSTRAKWWCDSIPTLYFAFPPAHSPNSFLLSKTRTILRRDPFEQRPEHGARQMFRIQTLSKSQDSPPLQDLDPHQDDEKTCMISIPFGSLGVDG